MNETNIHHAFAGVRTAKKTSRCAKVGKAAESFARVILEMCPDCQDRDDAIRYARTASMYANTAIATNGIV